MESTQNRPSEHAREVNRCDLCGATFPSEGALHSHQERVHPGERTGDEEPSERAAPLEAMPEDAPEEAETPAGSRLEPEERSSSSEPTVRDPGSDHEPAGSVGGDGAEGEPAVPDRSTGSPAPGRSVKKGSKRQSRAG
jgi:hypothetical protein